MGSCFSKICKSPQVEEEPRGGELPAAKLDGGETPGGFTAMTPARSCSSTRSTPLRIFKRPLLPPSPAKHIMAQLAGRNGSLKNPSGGEAAIPEGSVMEVVLDKSFGFSRRFAAAYELGAKVGTGHFGSTSSGRGKNGEMKGKEVAVKIISKAKITTAIGIEDVKREVRILRSLSGHRNIVQFYDAFEDEDNVYIVMELCKGGELLDMILARGGKFSEGDAKDVVLQMLSAISFCHLQGVVHRDIKPENFIFTSKDEKSLLKLIDFGLSDVVNPDENLEDIVGSVYYVSPEVLRRSYGTEADMWSIGVIVYILLCGGRPFWARTESAVLQTILTEEPDFVEAPWPSLSEDAMDFVSRLLHKDPEARMTTSQALCHPWIRDYKEIKIPLDMMIYKLARAYISFSSLKKSAVRALAKTLTVSQLFYLREQFSLLEPNREGCIAIQNFKTALMRNTTQTMRDSGMLDFVGMVASLQYHKLDFKEFAASAISVRQLEVTRTWEKHTRRAYEAFDRDDNRVVSNEDFARELGLPRSAPAHSILRDCVRESDGKLSFAGFMKLLNGEPFNRTPSYQRKQAVVLAQLSPDSHQR